MRSTLYKILPWRKGSPVQFCKVSISSYSEYRISNGLLYARIPCASVLHTWRLFIAIEHSCNEVNILKVYLYIGTDYNTSAQKKHIVSLVGNVTSPTTVTHYVSMTCSEHREALNAAPTADGVHTQAIRVQG